MLSGFVVASFPSFLSPLSSVPRTSSFFSSSFFFLFPSFFVLFRLFHFSHSYFSLLRPLTAFFLSPFLSLRPLYFSLFVLLCFSLYRHNFFLLLFIHLLPTCNFVIRFVTIVYFQCSHPSFLVIFFQSFFTDLENFDKYLIHPTSYHVR